jgi:hypothetical protein
LLLNAPLDTFLTANRQNDKMVQLVCVNYIDAPLPGAGNSGPKIGTYLIKTKTSDVCISYAADSTLLEVTAAQIFGVMCCAGGRRSV